MNINKTIFSGPLHTVALTSEEKLVCWGIMKMDNVIFLKI
jgi:hypothetical protein